MRVHLRMQAPATRFDPSRGPRLATCRWSSTPSAPSGRIRRRAAAPKCRRRWWPRPAAPPVRAICRSSAGATSCAAMTRARSAQFPAMSFVRRSIDSTSVPPSRAFFADRRNCSSALSIRKAGGTSPMAARGLHPAKLAVELLRVGLQPREIRLGISGVLDSMVAVEEARDVEIGADVLDDHIGRVAPAPNRYIAVREREPCERRRIRASNDLETGARGMRKPGDVEGVGPLQVVRSCLTIRCCPSAERSASCDRSAALAPVSMPRDVALSGKRRRRFSASSSSSASASRSVVVGVIAVRSPAHADSNGSAAKDVSAATASRRLINESDKVRFQLLGKVGLCSTSYSTKESNLGHPLPRRIDRKAPIVVHFCH